MKKTILACLTILTMAACNNDNGMNEQDTDFAKRAAQDGMMEIKLGELAMSNASSQEIKDLADQIVRDHKDASEKLKKIAAEKNIELPTSLNDEQQEKYDEMSRLSGAEFDEAYAECMVRDHDKAINLFEEEAEDGEYGDLKSFASNTLGTLKKHLEMAENARDQVKNNNQMDESQMNDRQMMDGQNTNGQMNQNTGTNGTLNDEMLNPNKVQ